MWQIVKPNCSRALISMNSSEPEKIVLARTKLISDRVEIAFTEFPISDKFQITNSSSIGKRSPSFFNCNFLQTISVVQFPVSATQETAHQKNSIHFPNLCIHTAESVFVFTPVLPRSSTREVVPVRATRLDFPFHLWLRELSNRCLKIMALLFFRQEIVQLRICEGCNYFSVI